MVVGSVNDVDPVDVDVVFNAPDTPEFIPAINTDTITRRIIPPTPMAIHSSADLFFVVLSAVGPCGCCVGEVTGSLDPQLSQNFPSGTDLPQVGQITGVMI